MSRFRLSPLAAIGFGALAIVVASGCRSQASSESPSTEPIPVVVLHTNDNWGETEPCG